MKPNLSNSYKNSDNSTYLERRMYPSNAKVIHLADHKLKKRVTPYENIKSRYYIQRSNVKFIRKNRLMNRVKHFLGKDFVMKSLFTLAAALSLMAVIFFVSQAVIKIP